jgi:hypothetical protein
MEGGEAMKEIDSIIHRAKMTKDNPQKYLLTGKNTLKDKESGLLKTDPLVIIPISTLESLITIADKYKTLKQALKDNF